MSTIITGSCYRLTFLTSRLVRLEYQKDGIFQENPEQVLRERVLWNKVSIYIEESTIRMEQKQFN